MFNLVSKVNSLQIMRKLCLKKSRKLLALSTSQRNKSQQEKRLSASLMKKNKKLLQKQQRILKQQLLRPRPNLPTCPHLLAVQDVDLPSFTEVWIVGLEAVDKSFLYTRVAHVVESLLA